uniref:Uncharacterized protein n=1 Tax=Panagrellus redivivus TaxID=6233 RepID=A0A7E4VJP4_PANRE
MARRSRGGSRLDQCQQHSDDNDEAQGEAFGGKRTLQATGIQPKNVNRAEFWCTKSMQNTDSEEREGV